jgi:hypothetical protein
VEGVLEENSEGVWEDNNGGSVRTTAEGAWEDNFGGGGRVREQREDEGGQQWKEPGRTAAMGF